MTRPADHAVADPADRWLLACLHRATAAPSDGSASGDDGGIDGGVPGNGAGGDGAADPGWPDPAAVDWEAALDRAADNGVGPLVHEGAPGPDGGVPPEVMDRLGELAGENARRSLRLTRELVSALDALADAGVEAVPFKGPILAATAYGDVARRRFGDLDLLVRAGEAERAVEALAGLGLEHRFAIRPEQFPAFVQYRHTAELRRPADGTEVDLHWRLVPRSYPVAFDPDGLRERAETTTLAGRSVRTLGPTDRLVYLCVHGTRHGWAQLKWVCDVARAIRSEVHRWVAVLGRARAVGAARHLGVGLALARDLLGVHIPAWVGRDAMTPAVEDLVEDALVRIFGDPGEARSPYAYRLAALARRRDRIRYRAELLARPVPRDFERWRLSGRWAALYPLLRPRRVLGEHGLRPDRAIE